MRRRTVLAAATIPLAGCGEALAGPDAAEAEDLLREHINDERTSAGVPDLYREDALHTAARDHSRDMAERDFYAHENPDGELPHHRVPCRASENIHRGEIGRMKNVDGEETWSTRNTDELAGYVAEGWVLSEDHYQNMVNPRWQAVGVGIHVGDDEFFATAMFC